MKNNVILQMEGISKLFPGVKALDNVHIELKKGEVLALIGENGAGKSTLVKILSGVYHKDAGRILFDGKEVDIRNPKISQDLGISIIYQEFNLVPTANVAENIFISQMPHNRVGWVNFKKLYSKTKEMIDRFNLEIDPHSIVSSLSVAEQQMVEILKALVFDAKIMIMDEPTSSLSFNETEKLFNTIKSLRSKEVSIIYISHRLEEIPEVADRITILRDGKNVGEMGIKNVDINKIIKLMVGREIKDIFPPKSKNIGQEVLKVKDLTSTGQFYDISFSLKSGEILGFAGLIGAGRTELAHSIFGAYPPESGEIYYLGQKIEISNPRDAIKLGIGMVTEDKMGTGLIKSMVIRENISLASIDDITRMNIVSKKMEKNKTKKAFDQLDIRAPGIETAISSLSGGNQQKVILARWLQINPKVLILDEPTKGIDVGAKTEIFNLIRQLADSGVAILMINSELHEVIGLCDRIIVMSSGRIAGELNGSEATADKIMNLATRQTKVKSALS